MQTWGNWQPPWLPVRARADGPLQRPRHGGRRTFRKCSNGTTRCSNVGSGGTYAVSDLADQIGGPWIHIPKRPGEPECTFADTRKIQQALGWRPRVRFCEGVASMLERLEDWKQAPVWTPDSIAVSTAAWHRYLA